MHTCFSRQVSVITEDYITSLTINQWNAKFWGGTWSLVLIYVLILFVWGGACISHDTHWRSKESWFELFLSFHHG